MRTCCRADTIVHAVEISGAISGASPSSSAVMESRREEGALWPGILQTQLFQCDDINCNTSSMPLAFNVIKYLASGSEDIYFHFYL